MKRFYALAAMLITAATVGVATAAPAQAEDCWETIDGRIVCLVEQTTTTVAPTTTTSTTTTSTTTTLPPTTTSTSTSTSTTSTTSSSTSTTLPPVTTTTLISADPCPGAPNTPGGEDPFGGCWPGEHNTGVPINTSLTAHVGSCTLAEGTFDAEVFNCDVTISGQVTITRSQINGTVRILTGGWLTISDSFVDASPGPTRGVTGISANGGMATMDRVEVVGGNRSVLCDPCTIRDSYLHGQQIESPMHASAIRLSQNATVIHSTLWCEPPKAPPEGGCSANQTGYPDFEPTMNWFLERNLFMSGDGLSFCAFGGNSDNKPYSDHPNNATNIVYRDNVFRRDIFNGHGAADCGLNGNDQVSAAIVAFETKPGNIWQNNVWADNGAQIPPRD